MLKDCSIFGSNNFNPTLHLKTGPSKESPSFRSLVADQRTSMSKEVVHVPLMGDDDADLNEMTDEIHDQRLATALTRFWHRQLIEMDELDIGKFYCYNCTHIIELYAIACCIFLYR